MANREPYHCPTSLTPTPVYVCMHCTHLYVGRLGRLMLRVALKGKGGSQDTSFRLLAILPTLQSDALAFFRAMIRTMPEPAENPPLCCLQTLVHYSQLDISAKHLSHHIACVVVFTNNSQSYVHHWYLFMRRQKWNTVEPLC